MARGGKGNSETQHRAKEHKKSPSWTIPYRLVKNPHTGKGILKPLGRKP